MDESLRARRLLFAEQRWLTGTIEARKLIAGGLIAAPVLGLAAAFANPHRAPASAGILIVPLIGLALAAAIAVYASLWIMTNRAANEESSVWRSTCRCLVHAALTLPLWLPLWVVLEAGMRAPPAPIVSSVVAVLLTCAGCAAYFYLLADIAGRIPDPGLGQLARRIAWAPRAAGAMILSLSGLALLARSISGATPANTPFRGALLAIASTAFVVVYIGAIVVHLRLAKRLAIERDAATRLADGKQS